MPSLFASTVTRGAFNLSSILLALPSTNQTTQTFTRCPACLFSTTSPVQSIKRKRNKRKSQDPYRAAQARQRKSANIARQIELQNQRKAALGDPVRSQITPFMRSLQNPGFFKPSESAAYPSTNQQYLNFFLKPTDVEKQLAHSKWLTEPVESRFSGQDSAERQKSLQQHADDHVNAERALMNITSVAQGTSKDRSRINLQRCIDEFGRHNTDRFLAPKPASANPSSNLARHRLSEEEAAAAVELDALPKRIGADTGSSEVQIAILTSKINNLADNLGRKDKVNKRNLRVLVHRRQKLLTYLRRRERGGPRWQHLVNKLGINDAMWKGEISL